MTNQRGWEVAVVSNCANPDCRAPFRFMHSGRVFRFDFPLETAPIAGQDILWDANGLPRRTELFWLCENCVRVMTLVQSHEGKVKIERITATGTGDD